MSANERQDTNSRQVGGAHYNGVGYQHWDWVLSLGLPYLEAHATKYLARWNRKGQALGDLEKTLHFIEKIKENGALCQGLTRLTRPCEKWLRQETLRFFTSNSIWDRTTQCAIELIATWEDYQDLDSAAVYVRQLIGRVKQRPDGDFLRPEILEAKVAPLEDSNKHADRDTLR